LKDEEIDDLLNKAASAPHALKPELLERISASIQASLRPVRPLPPNWIITCALVFICAVISIGGAARIGFAGFEKMDLLKRLLVFPLLLTLMWIMASRFVREMIPGSLKRISAGALLILGSSALLALFGLLFHDYQVTHFFSIGMACLIVGLVHAVVAGLLSWILLRRGFAVNAVSAGLIAGALGGVAGLGVLELQCPNFEVAHLLIWHTGVVPVSSAAGALIGWSVDRIVRLFTRFVRNRSSN
jgi:hypothetical protein